MINFVRRSSNKSHNQNEIITNCSSNVTTVTSTGGDKVATNTSINHGGGKENNQKIIATSLKLLDLDPEVRLEEKLRRKAFAHYDVQSISASLINASKSSTAIGKRRNTTTGASAASFVPSKLHSSSKDSSNTTSTESDSPSDSEVLILDDGDGRSNELVQSCPYFRNELGGEEERIVCLNRITAGQAGQSVYSGTVSIGSTGSGGQSSTGVGATSTSSAIGSSSINGGISVNGQPMENYSTVPPLLHKPSMAVGLSLLENANERRWKLKGCPYHPCKYLSQQSSNSSDVSRFQSSTLYHDTFSSFVIEHVDVGVRYYREHFHGLEHQNWFGMDENLGPIAISIRKERVPLQKLPFSESSGDTTKHASTHAVNVFSSNLTNGTSVSKSTERMTEQKSDGKESINCIKHQYRVIIRTSDLNVLRGIVYEDVVPGLASLNSSSNSKHNSMNNHHAKEIIEYISPEITSACLRLGTPASDEQVIKLDEQSLNKTYKVGVLYCKYGQGSEEEMYNNEYSSRAFDDFLLMLGEKVRLKGFTKYKAGLDNKTDTTGSHCIYTQYLDHEITFHVSTLLPFTPNNRQQLLRKRHVGNDIVTIIFQEPGAKPFTPKTIRSHFQHVFIVVRLLPPETTTGTRQHPDSADSTNSSVPFTYDPASVRYQVAVTRSKEVPVFGPPIAMGGIYSKSTEFTQFILAKVINGENAAHRSDKFKSMAQRTRHEYLKDLAENYSTNTTLTDLSSGPSAGAKLVSSIFGAGRKNRSNRGIFRGDSLIQGSIVWDLLVEDYGQSKPVDCQLGISFDTFVIIDESTKEIIFSCPNFSILGWSSHPSYIKIYFHQGEVVFLRCKDPDLDEIAEIVTRLKAVTSGCESQELILRRNSLGQLGFHFIQEGIVTDVEPYAFAWQAGLRPNFRIVEICTVAIATLDHEGIKDLLKTSMIVSVTVLPPKSDGTPRRGCPLANCPYLSTMSNGSSDSGHRSRGSEYENISGIFERTTLLGSDRRRKGQHRTVIQTKGHSLESNSRDWNGHDRTHGSKSQPVSPDHGHRMINERPVDVGHLNHGHGRIQARSSQLTRTESESVRSIHSIPPASTSSSPLSSWTPDIDPRSTLSGQHFDTSSCSSRTGAFPNVQRMGSAFKPVQPRDHNYHGHPSHRNASDLKLVQGPPGNLTTWHSELSLSSKTMTSSNTSLSKEDHAYKYNRQGFPGQQQMSPKLNSSNNGHQGQLASNQISKSSTQLIFGLNGRPFLDSLVRDSHGVPIRDANQFRDARGDTYWENNPPQYRDGPLSGSFRLPPGSGYVPMHNNQQQQSVHGQPVASWTTPLPKSVTRRNGQGMVSVHGHPSLSQSSSLGPPSFGPVASSTLGRSNTGVVQAHRFPPGASYGANFRPIPTSSSRDPYKSRIKSGSNKSSGSSCSGSSSTLQEDLLRLINPDFIGTVGGNTKVSTMRNPPELSPPKDVRTTSVVSNRSPGKSDIITMAATPIVTATNSEPSTPIETSPATKVSTASPQTKELRLPILIEGSDAEWSTLVDTATKAMASVGASSLPRGGPTSRDSKVSTDPESDLDAKESGSICSSPDLDESLSWLEEFSIGKKSPHSERSPGRSSESTGRSLDGHGRTPDSVLGRSEAAGLRGSRDAIAQRDVSRDATVQRDALGRPILDTSESVGGRTGVATGQASAGSPKMLSLTPSESSGRSNSSGLEQAVEQLQKTNANLEDEVNKLREENLRLQEESQTATAQLRKFSEWFFQNINAK